MSTSPARLSRRSLLRGAASVTVVAAFAAATSCADDSTRADDAGVGDDPAGSDLLRLGHTLAAGGADSGTGGSVPGTAPEAITSDAAAIRAIAAQDDAVRADFATDRTVVGAGWLLAATEAEVLVAYAGACPLPAC